jgi:ubiquinone/menaquinone biosynthesis C-methylase UbiE
MKIDAQKYDQIARNVFAPVYPVIAGQILSRTGVTSGTCLDIGCGGGYLGAALAMKSDLSVHFFDQSVEMLKIAQRTIMENGLEDRSDTLHGDVSSITLSDKSVDLAVSRGSVFFWDDPSMAFKEIYRVLSPGGWAYIGGGFGSRALKDDIKRKMADLNQSGGPFNDKIRRHLGPETRTRFESALASAGIDDVDIVQGDGIGLWLVVRK